jgi:hypothetical protein
MQWRWCVEWGAAGNSPSAGAGEGGHDAGGRWRGLPTPCRQPPHHRGRVADGATQHCAQCALRDGVGVWRRGEWAQIRVGNSAGGAPRGRRPHLLHAPPPTPPPRPSPAHLGSATASRAAAAMTRAPAPAPPRPRRRLPAARRCGSWGSPASWRGAAPWRPAAASRRTWPWPLREWGPARGGFRRRATGGGRAEGASALCGRQAPGPRPIRPAPSKRCALFSSCASTCAAIARCSRSFFWGGGGEAGGHALNRRRARVAGGVRGARMGSPRSTAAAHLDLRLHRGRLRRFGRRARRLHRACARGRGAPRCSARSGAAPARPAGPLPLPRRLRTAGAWSGLSRQHSRKPRAGAALLEGLVGCEGRGETGSNP